MLPPSDVEGTFGDAGRLLLITIDMHDRAVFVVTVQSVVKCPFYRCTGAHASITHKNSIRICHTYSAHELKPKGRRTNKRRATNGPLYTKLLRLRITVDGLTHTPYHTIDQSRPHGAISRRLLRADRSFVASFACFQNQAGPTKTSLDHPPVLHCNQRQKHLARFHPYQTHHQVVVMAALRRIQALQRDLTPDRPELCDTTTG